MQSTWCQIPLQHCRCNKFTSYCVVSTCSRCRCNQYGLMSWFPFSLLHSLTRSLTQVLGRDSYRSSWRPNWLSESPSSGCRQHDQSTTVQSLAPPPSRPRKSSFEGFHKTTLFLTKSFIKPAHFRLWTPGGSFHGSRRRNKRKHSVKRMFKCILSYKTQ